MAAPTLRRSPARRASARLLAALLLAAAVGVAATAGAARWTLPDDGALGMIVAQIEQSTGLDITADRAVSLRVLPRPVVELRHVSFRSRDGAVQADADAMRASLDLPALATGALRLAHVQLDRATVSLDADRVGALVEPMLRGHPGRLAALLRTGGLTLRDGVIRVMSSNPAADTVLTEVSMSFAWPAEGGGASLSGTARWRGTTIAVTCDLDSPDALIGHGESLGSIHLRSEPVDLQVIATLSGNADKRAVGRIAASTPSVGAFLRLIDLPAPQLGGIARAHLDGSMTLGGDTLSISDATVGLEDMQFEGALAVHRKGDRPALSATLATDRIDLGRFLNQLPPPLGRDGSWTARPLATRAIANDDIDLRVSAAHANLGPFRIEDSSLSLQSGDGRLELSLGEARAYDGLLKARVVAEVDGEATAARLDAALSRLDLRKMLADADSTAGSGILTGHVGVEARGSSPAELVRTAQGHGELTLRDGALDPAAVHALMRRDGGGTAAPGLSDELGSTFDDVAARFRIARGEAILGDSWIAWPEARAILSGTASLPDQRLDLGAVLSPLARDGDTLAFGLAGPWRDLRLAPARPPS